MKYQIDQSGKIEQTNLNTIIAITNSQQMSVLLKKADKRKLAINEHRLNGDFQAFYQFYSIFHLPHQIFCPFFYPIFSQEATSGRRTSHLVSCPTSSRLILNRL